METITCIDDLREAARRKVPRAFFDFVEGGSYSEQTLLDNRADFEGVKLRQRVLTDVANRNMQLTIVGEARRGLSRSSQACCALTPGVLMLSDG